MLVDVIKHKAPSLHQDQAKKEVETHGIKKLDSVLHSHLNFWIQASWILSFTTGLSGSVQHHLMFTSSTAAMVSVDWKSYTPFFMPSSLPKIHPWFLQLERPAILLLTWLCTVLVTEVASQLIAQDLNLSFSNETVQEMIPSKQSRLLWCCVWQWAQYWLCL